MSSERVQGIVIEIGEGLGGGEAEELENFGEKLGKTKNKIEEKFEGYSLGIDLIRNLGKFSLEIFLMT